MERVERLRPTKNAVMFLIHNDGKYLIEERTRKSSSHRGFFLIPAGHVEDGEEPEDTVVWEAIEEHGVVPTKIELLDFFENMSLAGDFFAIHAYLVREYKGIVKNNEPEKCELHWLTYNEAKEKVTLASNRLVLILAENALSG